MDTPSANGQEAALALVSAASIVEALPVQVRVRDAAKELLQRISNAWSGTRFATWPWQILALVGVTKLILTVFALASYQINADQRLGGLAQFLSIWNRWDGPHYLSIAQHGYQTEGDPQNFIVFYPLFPFASRVAGWFTGDVLSGVFVVSTIASFAAAVLLYKLVLLDRPKGVAERAVWFLLIFPTSYVLHIGYTESLFLALTLGSFLAARQDRWFGAGLLAGLACLTRVNGLVLVGALGVEVLWRLYQDRRWNWRWLWLGLGPLGFLIYLGINYQVYGDPFAFQRYLQENWAKSFQWPWLGIQGSVRGLEWRGPADRQMVAVQELTFVGLCLVVAVVSWFRLRPAYAAFVTVNLILFTSTSFVLSVPRYALILFPIYILFADLAARNRVWERALTLWSLLFLALFMTRFMQGQWAF